MRKLLLLLLLLSPPAVADDASGESAYEEYLLHIDNAIEFIRLEDMEMACSEMRSASIVLMINFNKLQQYKPGINWFQSRAKNQKFLDDLCAPYGDGTSIMSRAVTSNLEHASIGVISFPNPARVARALLRSV